MWLMFVALLSVPGRTSS